MVLQAKEEVEEDEAAEEVEEETVSESGFDWTSSRCSEGAGTSAGLRLEE